MFSNYAVLLHLRRKRVLLRRKMLRLRERMGKENTDFKM